MLCFENWNLEGNINNNNSESSENEIIQRDFINIKSFILIIKSRKKILIITSLFALLISIINLVYKRVNNPEYLASFSLMIRDPILDQRRSDIGTGFLESIAVNNQGSDIPTLIEFLKSQKVLSKIAEKNNINVFELKNNINIVVPRNPEVNFLPSILKVNVTGSEKSKLHTIVKDLTQEYLLVAAERKQEKLTDGIAFLNK